MCLPVARARIVQRRGRLGKLGRMCGWRTRRRLRRAIELQAGFFVGSDRQTNACTLETIRCAHDLTSYGFISCPQDLAKLVTPLVDLLDGRNDVADRDLDEGGSEASLVQYEPPKRRWAKSGDSLLVTSTKVTNLINRHQRR